MIDKIGAVDRISFVLNGKPIQPKPTMICPTCKVDRFLKPCPNPNQPCPMTIKAQ